MALQSNGSEVAEQQSSLTTTTTLAAQTVSVDTNINVIYDSDNYNDSGNQNLDDRSGGGGGNTSATRKSHSIGNDSANQQRRPKVSSKMSDFVNFDRVEAENGGYVSENYATCLVERSPNDSPQIRDQAGRLNFWQPVNNSGVMHLVAHYSYKLLVGAGAAKLKRRESFRAPVERAPNDNPKALDQLIRSNHLERDQIWLVDSCDQDFRALFEGGESRSASLLAELTRQQVDPATVEVDSELVVGQFNLTGLNEIASKHLLLFRRQDERQAVRIACCKVTQTDTMPASDLPESTNKTSLIQATRDYQTNQTSSQT